MMHAFAYDTSVRDLASLIQSLMPVIERASAAIMQVYDGAFAVQRKDDNSPLTLADLESQRVIIEGLERISPDIPILSEESAAAPWAERQTWRELWVVDPLDGTREFIKRNGEFTINIALIMQHEPVLGVVCAPAQKLTYWGLRGGGAFMRAQGAEMRAIRTAPPQQPMRVLGSRSHASAQTAAYLARLGPHIVSGVGSSLKFCLLAEGKAELYVRFGATSEWDTAAGQAVLEAAGGHVTRMDGHRLRYNSRESLINGDFIAFSDPSVLPT
jgi:3'(2'), 5'-bisphosphate nucleotidase